MAKEAVKREGVAVMTEPKPNQHPLNEGCFFCATDNELLRGIGLADDGKPWTGRTLHMQVPMSFCPHMTAEETSDDARR
jgi:hypothetical protein